MRYHIDSVSHTVIHVRRCTHVLILKERHIQRNGSELHIFHTMVKIIPVLFYKNATIIVNINTRFL